MQFTDESLEPFGQELLTISVPSQLGFKTPLVFRLIKLLKDNAYLPQTGTHMAELCFEEVLANAILHGNEHDANKKVNVSVFADGERWGTIVEDEGVGFGPEDLPDPNDPEAMFREGGRGIMLMDQFLDELKYSQKGNQVMLVRHKQTHSDAPEVSVTANAAAEAANIPDEPVAADDSGPLAKVEFSDSIELDLAAEADAMSSAPTGGLVTTSTSGGVQVVTLNTQRLTEDNASDVQGPLYAGCEVDGPVVIDLSQLEFLSSVGISTIMTANKKVMQAKRTIVMAGAHPAVYEIFKATGVVKLLKFEDSIDAAIAAAQG